MLKTNLLTPVLSGVLAVSVAGSGVLYVLDKKDGSADDKAERNSNTVLAKVSDKISEAAASVEKVVKGEAEDGYTCDAEITFGDLFSKEAGVELKPVGLKADSKIKGGKSETDLQLSYNSDSLANVYIITDSDTDTVYVKCPELGDAYLSMSPDDFQSYLSSQTVGHGGVVTSYNANALGLGGVNAAAPELGQLQNALDEVDLDAISKDIEEYWQVVKDNIPEGEEKEDISGEIKGNSYTYEVKTINVTLGTVKDIAVALADKAKDDQLIKDYLADAGVTEDQYKQMINQLVSSTNTIGEQQAQQTLFSLDVYSYEGEEVGFNLTLPGAGTIKMVSINTEEVFAIDVDASVIGASVSLDGAFNLNGDYLNGSANFYVNEGGNNVFTADMNVKDVLLAGDNFTGSIAMNVTSEDNTFSAVLDSTGTAEKPVIGLDFSYNGEKAVGLKITGEKTGASDVTIPSGTIYPFTEEGLKSYEQSCNVEGFKAHIKEVLGDELYKKLTESSAVRKVDQLDDTYEDRVEDTKSSVEDWCLNT